MHKSYIVNLSMVDSLEGNLLRLGEAEIPVSQHYYDSATRDILKDKVIRR